MPSIGVLLSLVLMGFTIATLSGLGVALVNGDAQAAEVFGILSLAYGVFSIFLYLVATSRPSQFRRAGVFIGAIAMWITLIFAAMPAFILLENAHPVVAFFEATSASITLGTSLVPVSQMSASMIFYRAMSAWLGGFMTLMLAVYVIGRYGVGGTPNRDLRFVLHGASRGNPRLGATFVEVAIPYIAVSILCVIALMLVGVEPTRAVLASLSAISTNGFSGWFGQGSYLGNRSGEIILMIFMFIGASSIIWQRTILSRQIFQTHQQGESRAYLLIIFGVIIVGIALSLANFPLGENVADDLFNRAFDIVATITTTGIVHNVSAGFSVPILFLIGLALVGGCSYSTAGGLKVFRVLAMTRHSKNEILRLVYPSQFIPGSVDTDETVFNSTKANWSAFFSAVIFIVFAMAVLAIFGHEFTAALTISVGAFTSVGSMVSQNLFSVEGGGVPYISLLWISIIGIVGRVELLVLLAAFSKSRW
ncbi:hypothetical protein MNBD_ALPHA11-789 [hydrothermal vent metagenome]|uniref:Trk potassium uptake system protein TrkH n=1 Tax=hydrothermal vent metagenome TaxID=652676 RepID=A0A3B0TUG6_9ZZZZ